MSHKTESQYRQAILLHFGALILTDSTLVCLCAAPVQAKEIVIKMMNQGHGATMVFEPAYVAASVGDRIRIVPTDAGHNAEPIPGMLPDGVIAPAGLMNKEYVLKLSKAGLYGIKCRPHFAFGMIALIKAGKGVAPNAVATDTVAAQLPTLAKRRMLPLLAAAK